MVYIFLADGFEEIEAITPYDYLKRSGVEVKTIGISYPTVVGSHGLKVFVDEDINKFKVSLNKEDVIILPGGLEGTKNLFANEIVLKYIKKANEDGVFLCAICAAPSILGSVGILENVKACCYPGFEKYLKGAKIVNEPVVLDKNIITSKGAGTSQQFAFAIIEKICGKTKCEYIKKQVQYQ